MKTKKLNYDFSIRDIEQTKLKHLTRIKKLKQDPKTLKDILTELIDDNVNWLWSNDTTNSYFSDLLVKFRNDPKQSYLKELKSRVNYITINHIKYLLKDYNKPESYFTAFYCIYYSRINNLMKSNLKELI